MTRRSWLVHITDGPESYGKIVLNHTIKDKETVVSCVLKNGPVLIPLKLSFVVAVLMGSANFRK
jgi:hypothetical protein